MGLCAFSLDCEVKIIALSFSVFLNISIILFVGKSQSYVHSCFHDIHSSIPYISMKSFYKVEQSESKNHAVRDI